MAFCRNNEINKCKRKYQTETKFYVYSPIHPVTVGVKQLDHWFWECCCKKIGILMWQVSQAAEDSNINSSTAENLIQLAGCVVTPTRNVNCSAAVYRDLPTWRTSKNNIDGAIRKLLAQVEALKVTITTSYAVLRSFFHSYMNNDFLPWLFYFKILHWYIPC